MRAGDDEEGNVSSVLLGIGQPSHNLRLPWGRVHPNLTEEVGQGSRGKGSKCDPRWGTSPWTVVAPTPAVDVPHGCASLLQALGPRAGREPADPDRSAASADPPLPFTLRGHARGHLSAPVFFRSPIC